MSDVGNVDWLADRLSDRTARGIAVETSALIRSGVLPIGARLPTVRDLAVRLGISPATVSEAWSELRRQKMISGRGRNGSWVSGNSVAPRPARAGSIGHFTEEAFDLSYAVPDRELLPPLAAALAEAATIENLNSYQRTPILPALRDAMSGRWPYRAEAFLATDGGFNAVYSALHALVLRGAPVAVEMPAAIRLLDIIEDLGAEILPVASDANGPLPDSLAQVLEHRPTAFIFQPRTHSITGRTLDSRRLGQLATVLERSDCLIIEDDGVGDLSPAPPHSIGSVLPERVVHILSCSKSLGPDLRLAVLSATDSIVHQVQAYRSFSSGWTSRLLQAAGAHVLNDSATPRIVARARDVYAARRGALAAHLLARDVSFAPSDGLCLWIEVLCERFALATLAARGIAVLPGSKCSTGPTRHIRLATSILKDRYDFVADAVALAAAGQARD